MCPCDYKYDSWQNQYLSDVPIVLPRSLAWALLIYYMDTRRKWPLNIECDLLLDEAKLH